MKSNNKINGINTTFAKACAYSCMAIGGLGLLSSFYLATQGTAIAVSSLTSGIISGGIGILAHKNIKKHENNQPPAP